MENTVLTNFLIFNLSAYGSRGIFIKYIFAVYPVAISIVLYSAYFVKKNIN